MTGFYLWRVSKMLPLDLMDETHYLQASQGLIGDIFWQDNFFYLLWIKVLRIFSEDALWLYGFNYFLLTLGACLLWRWSLRAFGVKPLLFWLLMTLSLQSPIFIHAYPYQTRFVSIWLALGVYFLGARRGTQKRNLFYFLGLFLCMLAPLVRQECYLILFLLLFRGFLKKDYLLIGVCLFFISLYTSLPLGEAHAEPRFSIAFLQHLAWHLASKKLWMGNVWLEYDKLRILFFNSEYSFFNMFKYNPTLVLQHGLWNLQSLPDVFRAYLPVHWGRLQKIVFFSVLGLGFLGYPSHKKSQNGIFWFALAPPLFCLLVVFPRTHYFWAFIYLAVLCMFSQSWFLGSLFTKKLYGLFEYRLALQTARLLYFLGTFYFIIHFLYQASTARLSSGKDTNQYLVESIRLHLKHPTILLSSLGSFEVYHPPAQTVLAHTKKSSWPEFQKQKGIKVLLLSPDLLQLQSYSQDQVFLEALKKAKKRQILSPHYELVWF